MVSVADTAISNAMGRNEPAYRLPEAMLNAPLPIRPTELDRPDAVPDISGRWFTAPAVASGV